MGDDQTKRGVAAIIPRRPRPRIVSMRIWSLAAREPASGCPPSKPSGKVPDTHSVGSIGDQDLDVFTITNIPMKNTDAVTPAHSIPRTPKAAYPGLQRCRASSVPLTGLARLAAWQSLCTGHIDASLGKGCSAHHRLGPRAEDSGYAASLRQRARVPARRRGRLANTGRRGSVSCLGMVSACASVISRTRGAAP